MITFFKFELYKRSIKKQNLILIQARIKTISLTAFLFYYKVLDLSILLCNVRVQCVRGGKLLGYKVGHLHKGLVKLSKPRYIKDSSLQRLGGAGIKSF